MTAGWMYDQWQRPMRDLRISVTDRCNFRCTYCMPKEIFGDDYAFLPKHKLLTFEEITRVARLCASMGVKKIRLTGGEPLLRPHLDELVRMLLQIEGIEDIGLTTNGLLLRSQGEALYEAGLRRINVSLDALDPDRFAKLNGRGITPDVILSNIEWAQSLGFKIKVNMVVQKHVNEDDILPMAAHLKEKGITLCFIEFMDVGNDNGWSMEKVITKRELYEMLNTVYELEPVDADYFGEVSKRYRYKGSHTEVGFISSVSETFCSSCTRARLSCDGSLYTCLFASEGHDLKEMLRGDAGDQELLEAIRAIWEKRTDRYSDERSLLTQSRKKINMSYIGG
ncbi:GTP 3',8-cyclase MoaA [Paenibacillus sp. 1001270B_150601_E10]|uniref:GTP 3',8-cyclase MoaA n=1 Tax=Paenibacillus sp. 1001270B_150601_E10 TaxID=2787079 RepID=UPI00189F03AA|nr:GTP 3',8-cyclase MoaA [Paenibacillus sp. 1001270B_150601_E10]